jgi:hypothetical protein
MSDTTAHSPYEGFARRGLKDPHRRISLDCGRFDVYCSHPTRVMFKNADFIQPEGQYVADGLHRFEVVLDRNEVPPAERPAVSWVDSVWHYDKKRRWWLTPIGGRREPATPAAHEQVETWILPALAAWLATDDGAELLAQGAERWPVVMLDEADASEERLRDAIARVGDLRGGVLGGEILGYDDEQWLRHLQVEVPAR